MNSRESPRQAKELLIDGFSNSGSNTTSSETEMSEDEKETELDKKIELIVERALEKHIAKLRGPQPTDPKAGESSRTKTMLGKSLISPSKG